MRLYKLGKSYVDSVELKCLVISRGVKIDKEIYRKYQSTHRIYPNALTCNCMKLPDGTITMLTDLGFHFDTLANMFSWDNLKLLRYMSDLSTPYQVALHEDTPVLMCDGDAVCPISFLPGTDFYRRKTTLGTPFMGNAVIQGTNWVSFQCLWPCEFASSGYPCQFCFSGGQFESLSRRHKPLPKPLAPEDLVEIIEYGSSNVGCDSLQLTGGSTILEEDESEHITSYLDYIGKTFDRNKLSGEILLYSTPLKNRHTIDTYFSLGIDRIACSLEVWDDRLANVITPGKRQIAGKTRYIDTLTYVAEKYGPGKAFSNFIIGLEGLDTLKEGARFLAERGIIPSASIWMPFGKPVMGSMKTPDLDYFRAFKDYFAELYVKYSLAPPGGQGLNVCVERDIWRLANS